MQTQNRLKISNNNFRKSHALLIGSFLIFVGFISIFWNYFLRMKDEVYSDMRIAMIDFPQSVIEEKNTGIVDEIVEDVPEVQNVSNDTNTISYVVDYSKYLGVLEIPRIGLKRGFYGTESRYNDIRYNVTMVKGSNLPDVDKGNLILIAHSGTSYYSYFAYLYRLEIGDEVFVTYGGIKYNYRIVDIYYVEKNGIVNVRRDLNHTTLTMITCTKDNDYSQTVYISELVS